jgi:hypothetical protein
MSQSVTQQEFEAYKNQVKSAMRILNSRIDALEKELRFANVRIANLEAK